ncbi:MAG: M20/M25/M40 family metallo-hydrolase, partial [Chloroflexi bacterium]|nr:M20/M25/M40 family metallo-hydrolase [Chloroflexota bacterium]
MHTNALLKLLVETESPSHDKSAVDNVGAIMAEESRKLGAEVAIVASQKTGDHVIARWGGAGKPILFVCHMDTVFPLGTIKTFPYREAEGKIMGPGVSDMKASLVISLASIEEAIKQGAD